MNKCQEALNQVTYKFEEADIFPQSTDAACKCQDEDDATKDDHDDGKVKYKVIDLNGLVVIFTVLKRILLKIRPHAHHQECYSNQLEHTMTQQWTSSLHGTHHDVYPNLPMLRLWQSPWSSETTPLNWEVNINLHCACCRPLKINKIHKEKDCPWVGELH